MSGKPKVYFEFDGARIARAELAEKYGLTVEALRKRLSRGMPLQEALNTPLDKSMQRRGGTRSKKTRLEITKLINWSKTRPCKDCNNKFHPEAMEFDHVRGVKRFELSEYHHYSWENILIELKKCDLVCANCHRIRTASRRK